MDDGSADRRSSGPDADDTTRSGTAVLRWLAVAGGAAVATVAALSRLRMLGWATGDDPCGEDGLTLPALETVPVTTDDGADLAVHVAGPVDGPVVVLAHCWMGGHRLWAAVARDLAADGHRVVLYDHRGHGGSTLGTDRLTVSRLGDDLGAVLEALDLHDVVLVGHSMGGMAVQALAGDHPDLVRERVAGIVLVATAARAGPVGLPPAVAGALLGERTTARLARMPAEVVLRGIVGAEAHRSHLRATHEELVATSGRARAECLVAMSRMDLRPGLRSVSVPTTVVVGTHDRLTPPARARALAGSIPEAALVVLDGKGHMLPLEAPAAVTAEIAAMTAATVRPDVVEHRG